MSSPFLKSGLSCSVWVCVQLMNLLLDSILNFVQRFSFEATLLQMLPNLCFCLAPGKKSKVFFFFLFFNFFCMQAFSSCSAEDSHCSGFSCCSSWALDPGPGIEPLSLALAAEFLTTGPLGKSLRFFF